MIKETLQLLTDALNDSTYGVNSYLSGSSVPTITAYDETRNTQVAMNGHAEPYPSLNVYLIEPAELQGEVQTNYRDGIVVRCAIGYMARNTNTTTGICDMWDTLRAVNKTLRMWLSNAKEADRVENGVQVISCSSIMISPNMVTKDDSIIPGGLTITMYVREIYT